MAPGIRRTKPRVEQPDDIGAVLADIHPYQGPGKQPSHAMAPRRVLPGDPDDQEYVHTPVRGPSVRLRAVGGVCAPTSLEEVQLADRLRLPVIPDTQET